MGGAAPRVRPEFEMVVPLSADEVVARVKAAMRQKGGNVRGLFAQGRIELVPDPATQHFWSPQLTADIRRAGDSVEDSTGDDPTAASAVEVLADDVLGVGEVDEGMQPAAREFESREQALGDGVVPAIALAARAAEDARGVEPCDVVVGAVGAATVRVVDEAGWRLAQPKPCRAPPGRAPRRGCRSSPSRPRGARRGRRWPRGTPSPPGSRRPSRRSPRTCSGVGGEVPLQVVGDALGVLAALGWLAVEPGVVAGGRHLKDAAHGHGRERLLLVLRAAESEPHWLSLAKNAAALLGISHSISSVLLSRRRRCSSSCSDVVSTGVSPPSSASCATFLTQPRIADSVKSERLATSGTLSPPVSARSSSVDARRGAPLLRVRSHQDLPCALSRVAGCPPNGGQLSAARLQERLLGSATCRARAS